MDVKCQLKKNKIFSKVQEAEIKFLRSVNACTRCNNVLKNKYLGERLDD